MYIYYWKSGLSAAKGDKITIKELSSCATNGNNGSCVTNE
jgi:hypothetical protein